MLGRIAFVRIFGGFRFRVWMPLVAVLIVLLSIGTLLLYVLPASRARLAEYSEERALARAAAAASAVGGLEGSERQRELDLASRTASGEVLLVDRQGRVVARSGPRLLSPSPPEEVLREASQGSRLNDTFGDQRVAVVPLVRDGNLQGGVAFAPDDEGTINQIFVRSGVEAALVASILGGGLALLLATILSRRVERLTAGARAIEGGELSHRIEPGSDDELGELARSFNSMAGRLQTSFDRLKEGGATLNAILNNLVEGVLATDLEGNVMFINLAARDMLNLGSRGPWERAPDPWTEFDLPAAVRRCARGGEEDIEARVSDGDNLFRVKLERMDAFDDHRGGVLVVIRDLSEGRRLEANQQRFLANAAHELRTPITTIVGASELLLTEEEDDPETRRRFLRHIHREARRMQRLSDTLLRLARTGVDLRDPDLEVLDLDGFAREAVERIRPLSGAEGLDFAVQGQGARVRADHEWLEQCLLIVLRNAVQHSSGGGVVRVRLAGSAVEVEDEGVGIAQQDLPHVFERFRRGGDSGGFGLGLAICRDLVERMGGSITLDSEEGVGTTVRIELVEVS